MATLLLSTLSIVNNTFVLCVNYRSTATHEMSDFTRWLFLGVLSRLVRMHNPMNPVDKSKGRGKAEGPPKRSDVAKYYENRFNRRKSFIPSSLPSFENSSFIGVKANTLELDKICEACVRRNMKNYPPTAQKGLDSGCFIATHYSDEDAAAKIKDEWRYVGLVIDRILLWAYTVMSFVIAVVICLNAPALYDTRVPLEATTPPMTILNITNAMP